MKRRAREEYQSGIREVAVVPGEIKGEEVNDASSIMCVDETELCSRIPAQILTVSELDLFSSDTNEKTPGVQMKNRGAHSNVNSSNAL